MNYLRYMPAARMNMPDYIKKFSFKKYPFAGHILFWLLYISYIYGMNRFYSPNVFYLDVFLANIWSCLTFYVSFYFWIALLVKRNYWLAALVLIGGAAVYYAGQYLYVFILTPMLGGEPYTTFNSNDYIRGLIFYFVQYFLFGMGFFFGVQSSLKEKKLRKAAEEKQKMEEERYRLEQSNALLEKQQLQTEYAFLRSQINPHFLQNTLNYFYSKSLSCSEELSSAILTLSEIMRYSLNTKTTDAPPLLTEEIKQMNNVIAINQMRFNNRLNIVFSQEGDPEGIRILPLVLITLVENAFKHGDLGNPEHPLTISLKIPEYQESLLFTVSNQKKLGPKDHSHGIGLENIRRRLQLVYGSGASLISTETADAYSITLNIKTLHP